MTSGCECGEVADLELLFKVPEVSGFLRRRFVSCKGELGKASGSSPKHAAAAEASERQDQRLTSAGAILAES